MKQQTKEKNFAQINGSCKTAPLAGNFKKAPCPRCGTVHSLRECPFCRFRRGSNR